MLETPGPGGEHWTRAPPILTPGGAPVVDRAASAAWNLLFAAKRRGFLLAMWAEFCWHVRCYGGGQEMVSEIKAWAFSKL